MKIKDILVESPTDNVARFYPEANADTDKLYNTECAKYKRQTKDYYDQNLSDWFDKGRAVVFNKPSKSTQGKYTTVPARGSTPSPGAVGLARVLRRTGYTQPKK